MKPKLSYRIIARMDALVNGVYTSRWNPLYHSGAIALALLGVLIVTGLYLLLFYRLGAPYASVVRINAQAWTGRWVQGVHRFASDAALVAALVHGFRMYAQRRTWGPRALAWVSGIILVVVLLVSGWTGYVLVWDVQAQLLAVEAARLLDALPIFSEPIGRSFVGERPLPQAFFFIMLFMHIALPIGLGALVWVHVARVARPVLLPARPVLLGVLASLLLLAVLWPLRMAPEADLLRTPGVVPLDWFYVFWLPVTGALPAVVVLLGSTLLVALLCAVPWLTRPHPTELPAPATVNARTCTGCGQCVSDCPYDAIELIARTDGRETPLARVRTELCTSCGICVGSCPPMAIGPMGVTGRDQLSAVRRFIESERLGGEDVVIVGCDWSAASHEAARLGARFFPVACAGSVHSSTIEHLLRGGAGGVLVVGCAAADAKTREGVDWTDARLFGGRRPELKPRVDSRRVRLVQASLGERALLHDAAREFREDIEALANAPMDIVGICRDRQLLTGMEEEAGR